MASENKYSIRRVSEMTGIEESEIRFYESAFKDQLKFTRMGIDENKFNEDHVDLLKFVKGLIFKRGFTVEEVRQELRRFIRGERRVNIKEAISEFHREAKMQLARVISVTSGKGGVGKSTVVTNLAVYFAQKGKKVAVFDADLGLANIHILMGVKPRFNLSHLIQDNFALDDIIAEGPLGIRLLSGGQGVRELANLQEEQRRILLRQMDQLEREVDILIVDTGAGISENVLRFASFADEVIVVTTPNIAASADAFSIIKIIKEMDPAAKVGLIANIVRDQYQARNVFNRIDQCCKKYLKFDLNDLGHILDDANIMVANQMRKPILMQNPETPASICLRRIGNAVMNEELFRNYRKDSSFAAVIGAIKRNMVGIDS